MSTRGPDESDSVPCASQSSSCVCQNDGKRARCKSTSCVGYGASCTRQRATRTTWRTSFVGQVAFYIGQRASYISQRASYIDWRLSSLPQDPIFLMGSYVGQRASCIVQGETCVGQMVYCAV